MFNMNFQASDNSGNKLPKENNTILINNNLQELDDLTNVCRVCAHFAQQVCPLFDDQVQCDLANKINKYLPIEISQEDGLPQGICSQCQSTLLAWDELVKCCEEANVLLQQRLALDRLLDSDKTKQKERPGFIESPTQTTFQIRSDFDDTVREVLTGYLKALNIDEQSADLEYVCQKCTELAASTSVEELTQHLKTLHRFELQNKGSVEVFVKDNITFQEVLIMDKDKDDGDDESVHNDNDSANDMIEVKLQNYCCPFCESVFSAPHRLVYHLNKHIEISTEKAIICCGELYENKLAFVTHLQNKHCNRTVDNRTCRTCGITTNNIEELPKHVSEVHPESDYLNERKEVLHTGNRQKYKSVVCPICKKTLSNKYNLRIHIKCLHDDATPKFTCEKCNKSYKSQGSLKYHNKIHHKGDLSYICSTCGEAFPTRGNRDVHARIHTGAKPFECHFCGKHYRAKNTLARHIDIHFDVRNYECNLCPKKFRKGTHLKYHLRTHEKKSNTLSNQNPRSISFEDYLHEQEECDDRSDQKDDTKNESDDEIVSDDDDRPLSAIAKKKSDLYQNFYDALLNYRNHFVTDHENQIVCSDFSDSSDSEYANENTTDTVDVSRFDDLTNCNMRKDKMDEQTRIELNQVQTKINGKIYYSCKTCGKHLSSTHTYIFHKRIHTGERPCVCHICGKQFRAPNALKRHVTETHEKRRWYTCSVCFKNFANSQNLKQHVRIHTGERPFVCPLCGKRFTQSGSLHVHLKTHIDHYPHQCEECGAKFKLRMGLTRHRLKHTGQRPHVCVHCGKAFRQKHELNSHILAHGDSKPHACSVCGTAFRQRRALRHHCKRVHQNELRDTTQIPNMYNHVPQYEG